MFNSYGTVMPSCTVQLWYNKQRPKKNGNASLYLQLIVGGESAEVPLKNLEWPIKNIDWSKKSLLPRFAGDEELMVYNAIIERERAKYWKVILDFLKDDIAFTITDIFKTVNQFHNGHLFCAFWEQAIKARVKSLKPKDQIKFTTMRPHTSSLKQLRKYLNERCENHQH